MRIVSSESKTDERARDSASGLQTRKGTKGREAGVREALQAACDRGAHGCLQLDLRWEEEEEEEEVARKEVGLKRRCREMLFGASLQLRCVWWRVEPCWDASTGRQVSSRVGGVEIRQCAVADWLLLGLSGLARTERNLTTTTTTSQSLNINTMKVDSPYTASKWLLLRSPRTMTL